MPQKVVIRTAAFFAATLIVAQVVLSMYYGLKGAGIPAQQSEIVTILTSVIALPAICFAALTSERNRATIAQLKSLASTDALTGVLNRTGFNAAVSAVEAGLAPQESAGAVLYLDADHFKSINDRFGHHVGDRVLALIGQALTSHTRGSDICGRLGGEEFAVLLRSATLDQALLVSERIRLTVTEKARELAIENLTLTISIGLAIHEAGQPVGECLQAADLRLYEAKAAGRNRIEHSLKLVRSA